MIVFRFLLTLILVMLNLYIHDSQANVSINTGTSYSSLLGQNNSINRFDTGTLSFYDRDLSQLILITNLYSPELRIVFLKNNQAIASWRMPNSSLVKPFAINKIDFYPTEIENGQVKAGSLLINTSRGDILSNLYTKETKFLRYGRELFSGRYKDIPIIEVDRISGQKTN